MQRTREAEHKLTFYLVGPSGAGKSTLGDLLANEGIVQFIDSDDVLVGVTGVQPWEAVLPCLLEWEACDADQPLLVAIGAGTQDIDRTNPSRPVWEWMTERRERVIAIRCTPDETLSRRSAHHISLQSVHNVEFDDARLQIYEVAKRSVDTSALTELEAALELVRALGLGSGVGSLQKDSAI